MAVYILSYLVNEIRSVLENVVKLGVNVPTFMIKGLEVANKAIEEITDKEEDN